MALRNDPRSPEVKLAHGPDGVVTEEGTDKGLGPVAGPERHAIVHEENTDKGLGAIPSPGSAAHAEAPTPAARGARASSFAATLMGFTPPSTVLVAASGERVSNGAGSARLRLEEGAVFAGEYQVGRGLADPWEGAAYEATARRDGARCQLHVLDRAGIAGEKRDRFVADARRASSGDAAHLLRTLDAGFDEPSGLYWIASERGEGEALAAWLDRDGDAGMIDRDVAWRLLRQLFRGLSEAHGLGVTHGDLRPAHVLVAHPSGDLAVKLRGFGLVHLREPRPGELHAIPAGSSPLWIAPEHVVGAALSPAVDVWAAGLLAFRLLAGAPYWLAARRSAVDLAELLAEMHTEGRVSASARAAALERPDVLPSGFDAWFARCVAVDPLERFARADEMAHAFGELAIAGAGALGIDYPGSPSRPTIPVGSRPPVLLAGSHVISADRETPEAQTVLRIPTGALLAELQHPVAPRSTFDDAPTMRIQQLPTAEGEPAVVAPAGVKPVSSAHPAAARPVSSAHPAALRREPIVDAMPPPAPPPPRPVQRRPWGTVFGAVLMALACVYAVHVAAGPGGLPGLVGERVRRRQRPDVIPVVTPLTRDPSTPLSAGAPLPWPAGTSRVWSGTLTSETSELSFVLVLRVSDVGRVAGYFSWTVGRLAGARQGEQVRESVEGSYEGTLGVLDLHGVLSTNPVVLAVDAYRLHVRGAGSLVGETLDGTARIVGALGVAAVDASAAR